MVALDSAADALAAAGAWDGVRGRPICSLVRAHVWGRGVAGRVAVRLHHAAGRRCSGTSAGCTAVAAWGQQRMPPARGGCLTRAHRLPVSRPPTRLPTRPPSARHSCAQEGNAWGPLVAQQFGAVIVEEASAEALVDSLASGRCLAGARTVAQGFPGLRTPLLVAGRLGGRACSSRREGLNCRAPARRPSCSPLCLPRASAAIHTAPLHSGGRRVRAVSHGPRRAARQRRPGAGALRQAGGALARGRGGGRGPAPVGARAEVGGVDLWLAGWLRGDVCACGQACQAPWLLGSQGVPRPTLA